MTVTWEIVKREDGRYDILRNRKVVDSAIPDEWLESQLVRYGFCGQEYRDIRHQLEQSGKAMFEFLYPMNRKK
jgi:hypothetical protein